MGSIERRLNRLTKLSAEDREDLKLDLVEAFEAADASDDLDRMEAILMDIEKVNMFEELLQEVGLGNSADEGDEDDDTVEAVAEETEDEDETVEAEAEETVEVEAEAEAEAETEAVEEAVEETVVEAEAETETPIEAVEEPAEEAVVEETVEVEAEAETPIEAVEESAETSETEVAETPEAPVAETEADSAAEAVLAEAEAIVEAVAPVELETPAVSEAESVIENTESEVVAMAASIVEPEDHAERAPLVASIQTTPRAGADIPGMTAGSEYSEISQINDAMVAKINSIRGSHGGDGEKRSVVTLQASIGEERQLSNANTTLNMERIEAVTAPTALTASGGYCAPLPVNYDIFGVGSNDRPVRNSLPTFGATRGGIRYIQPPVLGGYTGAISLWTAANDANPTNPATKPNLKVTCAAEATATTDAVTLSLTFGNLMSRAYPELVQRHNQLALIQHARFAERTLLNKIGAASTPVTSAYSAGSGRDFLVAMARASAAYRNRHRVPRGVQLRAIVPEWVRDSIREDIARNMYVEDLAVADATIDSWISARGINITWHMDDTFAPQAGGGTLNDFPGSITWWLFAEGTFLFLDGGTLDLGVVRDQNLVNTNDYSTFVETFEGIAKVGIESLQITTTTGVGPVAGYGGASHANTVQVVTVSGAPTGGTFTLSYGGQTTSAIAYNAATSAVQSALEALSGIGAGNVLVTGTAGSSYTLTFQGALGNQSIALLSANGTALTGGTSPTVKVAITQTGY